jgi:hypothetical protein
MSHASNTPSIWFPNQRVLRTLATRIVSGIPTGVAIVGILAAQWPAQWLVLTATFGIGVQTALTKIIALPGVNAWLTANTPIGSEPRK